MKLQLLMFVIVVIATSSLATKPPPDEIMMEEMMPTGEEINPVMMPMFRCTKRIKTLGGACQCHLIRIRAIGLFKRISTEGVLRGCRRSFGRARRWRRSCLVLTRSKRFRKTQSIQKVRTITDNCPGTLCNFFIIGK